MATYRSIAATEVDADSPVTQTLMEALADNPTAIAEAATDSPVVQSSWHPYNLTTAGGSEDGVYYDVSSDGNTGSVETPTLEDGFEYFVLIDRVSTTATADITFAVDGSSSGYGSEITVLSSLLSTEILELKADLVAPRISKQLYQISIQGIKTGGTAYFDNFGGAFVSSEKIDKIRFSVSTGNFDSGKFYLFRRKDYLTG